ncbi:MAG: two pore domain potassium channel family protein [Sphingobacteriales bacterium]|nr:MAG: two pore domain potassium channel family protein [Sphingobacteriales bacterium]
MLIIYFLWAFCGLYIISFCRAKRMSLPSLTHLFFNHFDRPGKIVKAKRLIKVDIVFPVYVIIAGFAFGTDKNHLGKEYDFKILSELGTDIPRKIKFAEQFKGFSQSLGLQSVSDNYYLLENDQKLELARVEKRFANLFGYLVWKYSCTYGTNLYRWFICSGAIVLFFAIFFSPFGKWFAGEGGIYDFFAALKPSVTTSSHETWFSPVYYSVVTFATLGYGDITPRDTAGQMFSVMEVLIGYMMLGGLLSVFSKKILR